MDANGLFPCLKLLHVTTVRVTGSLFVLRFFWMLQDRLEHKKALSGLG
jgi:uncharacterized membrane protein SirB2